MEIAYNIGKTVFIILILSVSIYFFIMIRKSQIDENKLLRQKSLLTTSDIKVYSIISSGFIDRGNEYSYCRFVVNDNNTVSLYFRFSLPKGIYYGPFSLVYKDSVSMKNLTYYISNFERDKMGKTYLHIKTRPSILSSYRIYMDNISEEDFNLIKKAVMC